MGSNRPKKIRIVQGISVSGLSSLNRLDSVMIPNQTPDGVNCSSGATSHVSISLEVVVDPREEVTDYLIFRTSLFSQTCDRGCQILPIVSDLKSSDRCCALNILLSLSSLWSHVAENVWPLWQEAGRLLSGSFDPLALFYDATIPWPWFYRVLVVADRSSKAWRVLDEEPVVAAPHGNTFGIGDCQHIPTASMHIIVVCDRLNELWWPLIWWERILITDSEVKAEIEVGKF